MCIMLFINTVCFLGQLGVSDLIPYKTVKDSCKVPLIPSQCNECILGCSIEIKPSAMDKHTGTHRHTQETGAATGTAAGSESQDSLDIGTDSYTKHRQAG